MPRRRGCGRVKLQNTSNCRSAAHGRRRTDRVIHLGNYRIYRRRHKTFIVILDLLLLLLLSLLPLFISPRSVRLRHTRVFGMTLNFSNYLCSSTTGRLQNICHQRISTVLARPASADQFNPPLVGWPDNARTQLVKLGAQLASFPAAAL